MRTLVATFALLFASAAFADSVPQGVEQAPLVLPQPTAPAVDQPEPESVNSKRIFGGIFLGLSSAAAISADMVGALAVVEGICFDDCNSQSTGSNGMQNAAIGLAIASAVTAAIGIPLIVSANNDSNAQKRKSAKKAQLSFSVAPSYSTQQGSGVSASLAVRF